MLVPSRKQSCRPSPTARGTRQPPGAGILLWHEFVTVAAHGIQRTADDIGGAKRYRITIRGAKPHRITGSDAGRPVGPEPGLVRAPPTSTMGARERLK
jgi:hypothetical protein